MTKPAITFLLGSDHPDLGTVAVEPLGTFAALALSAGRYPKPYKHVDPNEDAVCAVRLPDGFLVAAADGHNGFAAARAAITAIVDEAHTGALTGSTAALRLSAAVEAAEAAVASLSADGGEVQRASRTALSVAVVMDRSLAALTYGDTVVARIPGDNDDAPQMLTGPSAFLGAGEDRPPSFNGDVDPGDWILVASDGLVDYLGKRWMALVTKLIADDAEPASVANRLVRAACDGGAGDHVSVAVAHVE